MLFIACAAASGGMDSMIEARAAGGADASIAMTESKGMLVTAKLNSAGVIIAAAHAAFCGFNRCKHAAATSERISDNASPASSSSSLRIVATVDSTCCTLGGERVVPNVKTSSSSLSASSSSTSIAATSATGFDAVFSFE